MTQSDGWWKRTKGTSFLDKINWYIYIYIYIERERETVKVNVWVCVDMRFFMCLSSSAQSVQKSMQFSIFHLCTFN